MIIRKGLFGLITVSAPLIVFTDLLQAAFVINISFGLLRHLLTYYWSRLVSFAIRLVIRAVLLALFGMGKRSGILEPPKVYCLASCSSAYAITAVSNASPLR